MTTDMLAVLTAPAIALTPRDLSARGRNGWFAARRVSLHHRPTENVWELAVWSKRATWIAPIHLELTPADLAATGGLLLQHAHAAERTAFAETDAWLARERDAFLAADLGTPDAALAAMSLTQLAGQQTTALAAWARQVLNLLDPLDSGPADPAPPAAPGMTPVEVEWHADYYGGPWDGDCGECTVIAVPAAPELLTDASVGAAFQAQTGQTAHHILRWLPAEDTEAHDDSLS